MNKFAWCIAVLLFSTTVSAVEPAIDLKAGDTTRALLERYQGRPVKLRLQSGEEIGGIVVKVGDQMVQIGQLTGREFYDAAVRIDAVLAVSVRVRDR